MTDTPNMKVTDALCVKFAEAMWGPNWLKHASPIRVRLALEAALHAQPQAERHPDDVAVDRFAVAMKEKLARKRGEGRSGWEDKAACSAEYLSELLREHVVKGDPLDVGNLAMMLHQRGERVQAERARDDAELLEQISRAFCKIDRVDPDADWRDSGSAMLSIAVENPAYWASYPYLKKAKTALELITAARVSCPAPSAPAQGDVVRDALRPFAEMANNIPFGWDDGHGLGEWAIGLDVGDLRRASAAYSATSPPEATPAEATKP